MSQLYQWQIVLSMPFVNFSHSFLEYFNYRCPAKDYLDDCLCSIQEWNAVRWKNSHIWFLEKCPLIPNVMKRRKRLSKIIMGKAGIPAVIVCNVYMSNPISGRKANAVPYAKRKSLLAKHPQNERYPAGEDEGQRINRALFQKHVWGKKQLWLEGFPSSHSCFILMVFGCL